MLELLASLQTVQYVNVNQLFGLSSQGDNIRGELLEHKPEFELLE